MISSKPIYMDFGNTRLKMLIDGTVFHIDYDEKLIYNISQAIAPHEDNSVLYFSSVNIPKSDKVIKELSAYTFVSIESLFAKNKYIDLTQVKGMGTDRILGILGAMTEFTPPFVTIDCGTMITMNLLSQSLSVLGGIIFPGLRTMAKAAHNYTAALPLIQTFDNHALYGTNTTNALQTGILHACLGAINHSLQQWYDSAILPNEAPIIFTGGDGLFLYNQLLLKSKNAHYKEQLIINGMKFCVQADPII
jgi:type III pantothenate kinase